MPKLGHILARLAAYGEDSEPDARRQEALRRARNHKGRGLIERMAQQEVVREMRKQVTATQVHNVTKRLLKN